MPRYSIDSTERSLLFQLKWQDPFGHSMRERRSRMRNLLSTANQWAKSVVEWIERSSHEQLLAWAGKDHADSHINRIELVVLVRHHARFTGSESRTDKAVWGTWPQLCRIASEKSDGGDLLGLLARQMRDEQTRTDSSRQVESGRMSIGGVEIVVSATPDSA